MAKQTPAETPETSLSADSTPKPRSPKPKTAKPDALEVNAPSISGEAGGIVVPSAMRDSYLTVDSRMDGSVITVTVSAKEAPELVLENLVDSSGETGARKIEIPLRYLTSLMGFTARISYTGRSQGQLAASLVKEVGISFYPASESEELAPRLLHEKVLHNTPTYDMNDHEGNETVLVPLHPLAKAGDKVYCTAVTEQDAPPHAFYTVLYDHVLTEQEVASGNALRPEIARGWLARRKPWRSITLQSAWITSGLPAEPPADVDPHLETRLPRNALEVQRRRTAALIVAPGLDLPPPHLRQSVQYNDEWCLNPENTQEGGEVTVPGLDTYKGDEVTFYVSGPGYPKKLLGQVTVEQSGVLPTIKLPACVVACFFTKPMTLSYTLGFNDNEQSSPVRVINVLTPTFPYAQIEEATGTTLCLTTFKEDATAIVPVPAYSLCSSYCWMWFVGKYENGSVYRFDILERVPMTDAWKADGVVAPIARAALQELADCSTFELHFAMSFCEACDLASAFEFPAQTFKIEQEALVLVEPTVTEAVLTNLTAYNGRDGVHVEVKYAGSNPKHSISVCWKRPDDTCWLLPSKPGSTTDAVIWLLPPEAVIESMGKVVEITYTVTTACKVQTSPPLNLSISLPVRLETPNLRQATPPRTQNGIVDTQTFAGNADAFIDWMWFLRAGHKCWLRATGIDKSGAPYSFVVYAGRTITTAEEAAATEVAGPVLRSELMKAKDQSSMTYTFSVVTDGSGLERNAIVCPSRVLIVRVITMVTEDFSSLPYGQYPAGTSVIAPTMTIRAQSGTVGIHAANPAVPEMTSGNAIALNCAATTEGPMPTQTIDLFLTRGYSRVRFSFTRNAYHGVCYFYDAGGSLLGTRSDMPLNSWVDFNAPVDKYVAKISVVNQQHSYLDNFELYF
ncbi:hypothetical protein C4J89_3663 [Pseudomonas sp. R4-35-07]|uniref:hypothetical protein n=1 Tax=Pseudomonas sp. R4-35-07 TaxID=658643 RepID=UPI000F564647|nr:hypothetical protein [Pseudomonas sp. R4-35-07]AZF33121.1 hypothetical protein C4J89_3663 [Pseudomonas sp. R4-35-07]